MQSILSRWKTQLYICLESFLIGTSLASNIKGVNALGPWVMGDMSEWEIDPISIAHTCLCQL